MMTIMMAVKIIMIIMLMLVVDISDDNNDNNDNGVNDFDKNNSDDDISDRVMMKLHEVIGIHAVRCTMRTIGTIYTSPGTLTIVHKRQCQ